MIRFLQYAAYRLRTTPRWTFAGCCGLLLVSCSNPHNSSENGAGPGKNKNKTAALVATNSAPAIVQIPRSVFSTNVDEGRDPFFPESTRRSPRLAGVAAPVFRP